MAVHVATDLPVGMHMCLGHPQIRLLHTLQQRHAILSALGLSGDAAALAFLHHRLRSLSPPHPCMQRLDTEDSWGFNFEQ